MLDIVAALEWVRDNIAAFGGDPGNVMIFGQSGGGRKVSTLLAMPSAKGLFHRAMIESGATVKLVERDAGARAAHELLSTLGMTKGRVRELQEVPLEKIMSAYFTVVRSMNVDQMTRGFSPLVDGKFVPQHPFHPVASSVSADVPLMLGSTRTELTSSAAAGDFALSRLGHAQPHRARCSARTPSAADRGLPEGEPGATPSDLYFLIASDYRYSGPVMKIAERRAALGKGRGLPLLLPLGDAGRGRPPQVAAHDRDPVRLRQRQGRVASHRRRCRRRWRWPTRSATPGLPSPGRAIPNTPKLPRWTAFNAADRATMVIDNDSRVVNDPIREQRLVMFKRHELQRERWYPSSTDRLAAEARRPRGGSAVRLFGSRKSALARSCRRAPLRMLRSA